MLRSSRIWSLGEHSTLRLIGNTADFGSALAIADLLPGDSSEDFFHDLVIQDNVASLGATVFWLHYPNEQTEEPAGLQGDSITWGRNTAPYGVKVGTQQVHLSLPVSYDVMVYGTELSPPIVGELQDYYFSALVSDNVTRIVAEAVSYSCGTAVAFLSGDVYSTSTMGTSLFDDMKASCRPQGDITVQYTALVQTALLFGLDYIPVYFVRNQSLFLFRSCEAGERLISSSCEQW